MDYFAIQILCKFENQVYHLFSNNSKNTVHPEYPFKSHYADIDGHQMHYIDEGTGPVIVAIHGNPTWSFYYRKVISHLSKAYRVIALDNIGCGYSDKPQEYEYNLDRHIQNLSELLDVLGIDKCSIVVHDWGGAIGMGYSVRNPGNIEKIVITNTAAFRSRLMPVRIRLCRWPLLGELVVRGLNGFAWPATFMAVTRPLDKLTKQFYLRPYNSWKNRIAIHRFVKDIPLDSHHPSYKTLVEIEDGLDDLRKRKIPMMILWGGRDFCFTQDFYKEWLERFPEAEAHLFGDIGHYLLEDGFHEIEPYLTSFFDLHDDNSPSDR